MNSSLCSAIAMLAAAAYLHAAARQVTHGNDIDPSFSPDGRRMVVVTLTGGREQLSIMNIDGTGRQTLTNDAIDHEDPAWSPDGKLIAYVWKSGDAEVIHVMAPDGTHDRAVTPETQKAIHPAWYKDGARILYCTDDDLKPPAKNDAEIYVAEVATRAVQPVISGGVNTYPALSPDGTQIAFRRMLGQTNSEVFLAHSDGTQACNLTNHPAFDGWPDWSPDGQLIAFASNRDGNHKIYVMRPDGSDVRMAADTPGRGTAPRWTPDEKEIFFTICQREASGPKCEIYASAPPVGGQRK